MGPRCWEGRSTCGAGRRGLETGVAKGHRWPREGSGLQSPELPRGQEMGRLGGVPKAPAVAQGVRQPGSCQEEEEAGQNAAPSRLLVPPLQKLGQEEQRRGQQRQNQANQQVPSGKTCPAEAGSSMAHKIQPGTGGQKGRQMAGNCSPTPNGCSFHGEYLPQGFRVIRIL